MVSIFVHKSIKQSALNLSSTDFDIAAVHIEGKISFNLIGIYVHGSTVPPVSAFASLLHQSTPSIFTGDFNAHSPLWGGTHLDSRGRAVESFLDTCGLMLLNDGSPTFCRGSYTSAIDLTITSPSLANRITWSSSSELMGSDHFMVAIGGLALRNSYSRSKKPYTNWKIFRRNMNAASTNLNEKDPDYNSLIQAMSDSLRVATKTRTAVPGCKVFPAEISRLSALRRKVGNRARRNGNPADIIEVKRITAKLRRTISKSRKASWFNFCSSISEKTPDKFVWRSIKNISMPCTPSFQWSPLVYKYSSAPKAAETLGDHFFPSHQAKAPPSFPAPLFSRTFSFEICQSLNLPFKMMELTNSIRKCRRSCCPGPDKIPNSAITALQSSQRRLLLATFNHIWTSGEFPETWKTSEAVPILKPGKSPLEPSSYRIIALTSCVLKIMERMVTERLHCALERSHTFPDNMTGFRRHMSTTWNILDLICSAQASLNQREHMVVLFIDLQAAFDSANHFAILHKLSALGVHGNCFKFISNLIQNRSAKIKMGNTYSAKRTVATGVPQGGVLSPLLFNVLLADLAAHVPLGVRVSIYADDVAIWATGTNISAICQSLQSAISNIESFCKTWLLTISPEKTVALPISRTRSLHNHVNLTINGNIINCVTSHTFLGVTIDKTLSMKSHCDRILKNSSQRLNMLRCLSGRTWGANAHSLLYFYKAFIRSKILYSGVAMAFLTKKLEASLETAQSRALRICLGVPPSTPCTSLRAEAACPPLSDICKMNLDLLLSKIIFFAPYHSIHSNLHKALDTSPIPRFYRETSSARFIEYAPKPLPIPFWSWELPTVITDLHGVSKNNGLDSQSLKNLAEDALLGNGIDSSWTRIFTDGSLNPLTKEGGLSFVSRNPFVSQSFHLKKCHSSTEAELLALREGICYLRGKNLPRAAILSDSKAALLLLKAFPNKWEETPIVMEILRLAHELAQMGTNLTFCWIPAHCGILGNELADEAAKRGMLDPLLPSPSKTRSSLTALTGQIKSFHRSRWEENLQKADSGQHRSLIDGQIRTLKKFSLPRGAETLFFRMRLGTSFTAAFLAKINRAPSPVCMFCTEGVDDTIRHILLECSGFQIQRENLLQSLYSLGFQGPIGISDILGRHHSRGVLQGSIRAISAFIRNTGRFL